MTSFERYVRWIFLGTLSFILVVAGAFLLAGLKVWARGVILGGAASLLSLVIMAGDVRRQGPAVDGQGVRPTYGRYALRMAAIAAALIYAATNESIALWATIPFLFASQVVMTCGELLEGRKQEPS